MARESRLSVKRFDLALQLDQHWFAFSVHRFACRHFDPAFADTVFVHIKTLLAVEMDANAMLEHGGDVMGAARVGGQVVGQFRA